MTEKKEGFTKDDFGEVDKEGAEEILKELDDDEEDEEDVDEEEDEEEDEDDEMEEKESIDIKKYKLESQEQLTYLKQIDNIEVACEYSRYLVKQNKHRYDFFEEHTKGEIIRILSEKFIEENKEDLSTSNIVSILFENFEGFISKRTIYANISDKLKDPIKASAGRKGGKSKVVDTVSIENEDGSVTEIENPDPPLPEFEHEDIDDDETAIPYSPDAKKTTTKNRIVKLDKEKAIELDNALKASISCVYLFVDVDTDEVKEIYTDKKYDRVIIPTKAKTR